MDNQSDNSEEFIPVALEQASFIFLSEPYIELFLRSPSGKFIPLSSTAQSIQEAFQKYREKGASELYISIDMYPDLFEKARRHFLDNFVQDKNNKLEQSIIVWEILRNGVRTLGLSEANVALIREYCHKISRWFDDQKAVKPLWNQLLGISNPYYRHKFMTAYIQSMLVRTFDWQSEIIRERSVQAIFIRDILLRDDQILELKKGFENIEKMPEELREYPNTIGNLLSRNWGKSFPPDLTLVLKQFCERPEKKGFPNGINHKNILQMSALHILSDIAIDRILAKGGNTDDPDVLEGIEKEFEHGNYRRGVVSLKRILKAVEVPFGPIL